MASGTTSGIHCKQGDACGVSKLEVAGEGVRAASPRADGKGHGAADGHEPKPAGAAAGCAKDLGARAAPAGVSTAATPARAGARHRAVVTPASATALVDPSPPDELPEGVLLLPAAHGAGIPQTSSVASPVAEVAMEPRCSGPAVSTDAPAMSISVEEAISARIAESMTERLLVIDGDAPLSEGIRALIMHQLKREVGTSSVSLSSGQAELMEHHVARLSAYAQKVVHTLSFATRFLARVSFEGDGGAHGRSTSGEEEEQWGGGCACAYAPADVSGTEVVKESDAQSELEPRPPRKQLRLTDDEILSLYHLAQTEAAMEADWRGIPDPPKPGSVEERGGVPPRLLLASVTKLHL